MFLFCLPIQNPSQRYNNCPLVIHKKCHRRSYWSANRHTLAIGNNGSIVLFNIYIYISVDSFQLQTHMMIYSTASFFLARRTTY